MYRLAGEPDESLMVDELEKSPVANWEEYLQPIIRALKQQLGVDGVSLLSPATDVSHVSPELGFHIIGDVGFVERTVDVVNSWGTGPLPFSAFITPAGQLTFPISLGSAADVKFRKVL